MKCAHCGMPASKHHAADLFCQIGKSQQGVLLFSGLYRFSPPAPRIDMRHVARAAHVYSLAVVANLTPLADAVDHDSLRVLKRASERAGIELKKRGLDPATLKTPRDCLEAMKGRIWLR